MKTTYLEKLIDDTPKDVDIFVNKSLDTADIIRYLLKKKGLKQSDLAKKLGKSESEISRYLCGTHNFTYRSIAKIESILGEEFVKVQMPSFQISSSIESAWANSQNTELIKHSEKPSISKKEIYA